MPWATEGYLKILKAHFDAYFASTNNEQKVAVRKTVLVALRQARTKRQEAQKVDLPLDDDDDALDKVISTKCKW